LNKTYSFFPKNKQFWLYHGSLLVGMSLVQLIIFILIGKNFLLNIVIQVAWLPLYTSAVLIFRYFYYVRAWQHFTMAKLIFLTLLLSLVMAVFMSLLTLAIIWPLLEKEVLEAVEKRVIIGDLTYFVFYNSVISFLFISVWAFIYIALSTSRLAKESEIKRLRLENSLKEAKLHSLANQLNPHFLFNSLNNIRFMIYENAEHADNMITAFSDILRYSLTSSKQDKIAIEKELSIIERYIDIMQLQLGDKLAFQLHFSPTCQQCLIPPMILQILVENAIKHGIENIKTNAELTIDITPKGGLLFIEISNPVNSIRSMPTQGTGTGLKNIKQRLALLYGERAQLSVTSSEATFTVTLALPMEKSI